MRYLTLLSFFASCSFVAAQLASKHFTWNDLPYQADTEGGARGPQIGYNRCNSSTEGPTSLCQTAIINSLDDFCIWAPPSPGRTVGEIEGEMIAWCTQPGHGARVMPGGTITGVQFTKTPDYVQVVGYMDQTKVNMVAGDGGGEMDPHGADARGNPIGGLLFSNAYTGTYIQAVEWHNFNGGNTFCLKACDPNGPRARELCNNIYDTQGCGFNAPSNARDQVFESCASDSQNPPGVGAAVPPASSSCSAFSSTAIYGASASVTVPIPGAASMSFSSISRPRQTSTSSKPSATPSAAATGSKTSTGVSPSNTSAAMRLDSGSARIASLVAAVFAMLVV